MGGQGVMALSGTAFTFLVGLPFQLYLARNLGPAGLGIVGIAEALVMTAAGFLSFGLAQLAVRYIPEYLALGASGAIRRLLLLGLVILTSAGAIGAAILRPLTSVLPNITSIPVETSNVLGILGFLMPATMVVFFLTQALRGFQEIRTVVLCASVLALSTKIAITLILFTISGVSVRAYAWAMVLSQLAAGFPMAWVLWRLVRALPADQTQTAAPWREWFSFAGTNYVSGLLNNLVSNLDRVVIGALLGPASVGILMVVRQLQQFPMVFQQVTLTVVSPIFARLKAIGDMDGLAYQLHLANDWVVRLAAGIILVMAVQAEPLLLLYGPDFVTQGEALLLLIMLAAAVNLATGPVGILLNMTGYHKALLPILATTALVTFAGYFLLIPLLGLVGAGFAILLANLVNKGAAIWLVQTRLGLRWYDQRFRAWIAPIFGTATVLFLLRPTLTALEGLPAQAAGLIGVTLLAYAVFFGINLISGLHDDDREVLQALRHRCIGMFSRGQ